MLHRTETKMKNGKWKSIGAVLLTGCYLLGSLQIVTAQVPGVPSRTDVGDNDPNPITPKPRTTTQDVPERDLVVRIVKLEDRRMTVVDKDQEDEYTVQIAPDAKVTLNRKPAKVSELKPNDFVRMTLDPANPKLATVIAAARVIKDTPPSEKTINATRPAPMPPRKTVNVVNGGGLGLVVSDSPGEGILILDVQRGTPAWDAGIQTGDYLISFGDKAIITPDNFLDNVRSHAPNDSVRLELWRDGKTRKGAVKLTTAEAARDREAVDDRAYIVGETHGDDTVVIKRTPGRTETLDREPDQNTVVVDPTPQPPVVVEQRPNGALPENYDDLAKKYQELQQRFNLLEAKLNQLDRKTTLEK